MRQAILHTFKRDFSKHSLEDLANFLLNNLEHFGRDKIRLENNLILFLSRVADYRKQVINGTMGVDKQRENYAILVDSLLKIANCENIDVLFYNMPHAPLPKSIKQQPTFKEIKDILNLVKKDYPDNIFIENYYLKVIDKIGNLY